MLFVHLGNPDYVGHTDGHHTEAYYSSLDTAYTQIEDIYDAIMAQDAANGTSTLFIFTTDHGGINLGHDPQSPRYHLPVATPDVESFVSTNILKPLFVYAPFDNSIAPFTQHGDIEFPTGYLGTCAKLDDGYLMLDGVDFDKSSVTVCAFIKTGSP